jgi:ATP-dependent phosphofructokinase / diphosphate-dependent phosphofructokinase
VIDRAPYIGDRRLLAPRPLVSCDPPRAKYDRKVAVLLLPPQPNDKRLTTNFMSDIRCIGIATGGGDAPGLNAVIRAATRAAIIKYGWKVIGIPDGFDGLIWPEKSFELTMKEVSGILPRGGTILGTTNRGDPFHYKTVENGKEISRDISSEVIANTAKLGIDAIISIGGDGSQKIGYELFQKGLKIVGVPKTIDNDLSATQVTFGFDTALHTVTDAIDKIHTTAASHHRVMVVEVMGRDCGWIALEAGIAGGAHVILIPEIPFTIEHVCRCIAEREKSSRHFTIVVVAEGVKLPPELKENRRASPIANLIGNAIADGSKKEVRISVLGHIQRGGTPSPFDRILATRFGVAAVDLIAAGGFGMMVALHGDSIISVDVAHAIGHLKSVDPKGELVSAARAIGIGFGD